MKFFLTKVAVILLSTTAVVTGWMLMFEDHYIYSPIKELNYTPKPGGLNLQYIHLITD